MRSFLTLFIFLLIVPAIYADDYTDALLDKAIEEFSKENYEEALGIIDEVLEKEPDNVTAQMYKKTIEDVSTIEKIENLENTTGELEGSDVEDLEEESTQEPKVYNDFFAIRNYLAGSDDSTFYGETRAKVIVGVPVVEFAIRSNTIYYDMGNIGAEIFPFDEIKIIDKHSLDLNFGARYRPKNYLGDSPGFFDLKIGAKNFYNYNDVLLEDITIPYIGIDTETHLLKAIDENIIFNNLWFGVKANQYIYNTELLNNYSIGFKVGFRLGIFNFGGFYEYAKIDSVEYNLSSGGILFEFIF